MKMKILLLGVMLAFAVSAPASAIAFADIEHAVEIYNLGAENAPEVLKTLLGDEMVQIEINRTNGTALMAGLEMKDAVVVNTTEGEIDDPTILVKATEDAITTIFESDDPVAAFQEARDQGEISIEGTTWKAKAKVKAALASTVALEFLAGLLGK